MVLVLLVDAIHLLVYAGLTRIKLQGGVLILEVKGLSYFWMIRYGVRGGYELLYRVKLVMRT